VFVFQWQGRRRELGLGVYPLVSLARARELASDARRQIQDGVNPVEARRAAKAPVVQPAEILTFGAFAEEYIASVEAGWRNQIHRKQWRNSLRDHAVPLRDLALEAINTDDVLRALRPIWMVKPETASRVRGRIEKILAAAKARGLRPRDAINPALWKGHLDVLLPRQSKLSRGHHAAMPYVETPVFMRKLADRPAIAARALEFLIFNASRTAEVLQAKWGEIDGDLWTVPAERMKGGIPHPVPLTPAAIAVLGALPKGMPGDFIFPGQKPGRPLSNMSMEMLLRRMGVGEYTVHGFRSAFKDWAADCTEFPDEVSEEALAHIVGSKVRRAYRRGSALERRGRLMAEWSDYLGAVPKLTIIQDEAA
jgi:integrase